MLLDMAAVFAQMHGDAIGAGLLGEQRRGHWIGECGQARLAHRGDMIDIDAETNHGLRLLRLLCRRKGNHRGLPRQFRISYCVV